MYLLITSKYNARQLARLSCFVALVRCGSSKEMVRGKALVELELELAQSHMTQNPVLRGEVDARALRVQVRL